MLSKMAKEEVQESVISQVSHITVTSQVISHYKVT